MKRVRKVVIPVAGLGTRGLPFTKEVPKEMLPIIDTPTVQYIVEEVIAAGIEQVIFVTSKGKSVLEDYFDPSPQLVEVLKRRGKEEWARKIERIGSLVEVISVRQKEPLGLGHAILCASPITNREPFAVCLGDEIFPAWDAAARQKSVLQRIAEAADMQQASVVGVVEIPKSDTPSYGVIDIGGKPLGEAPTKVTRTVEKPKPADTPSPYAIIGRYVFEGELMDHLREVRPGVGGEIQLTDGMDRLCGLGKLFALQVKGPRYDIGNHVSYLKAQIDEAMRRPELGPKLREYLKTL